MPSDRLITARLVGEPMRAEHLARMLEMNADERVMATLGGRRTAAETAARHEANLAHWAEHGFGLWALFDATEGATKGSFVGRCGLRRCVVEGVSEVELAYAIVSARWREGLCTEAARAAIDRGFERLALDSIVAFTLPHNVASRRVMEKCGMRYERDFVHASLPHVLHRVSRTGRPASTG